MNAIVFTSWREDDGSLKQTVFIGRKSASRRAGFAEFGQTEAIGVCFKVVITAKFGGVNKDFDAAVLPAWLSILSAFTAEAFFGIEDVKEKRKRSAGWCKIDRNRGNGRGFGPCIGGKKIVNCHDNARWRGKGAP